MHKAYDICRLASYCSKRALIKPRPTCAEDLHCFTAEFRFYLVVISFDDSHLIIKFKMIATISLFAVFKRTIFTLESRGLTPRRYAEAEAASKFFRWPSVSFAEDSIALMISIISSAGAV